MAMQPTVPYIPYATYSKEQTGNIITFTQFEEGNSLLEYRNDTKSGNESDDNSTLPPLISEAKMDAMQSGDKSNAEAMYTDMLEDIRDRSQYNTIINRRDLCYDICDHFKLRRPEWKRSVIINAKHG